MMMTTANKRPDDTRLNFTLFCQLFWDSGYFHSTGHRSFRVECSTPNAIFTPTLNSVILPVLGSIFAVISFTSNPVIP
jgi:hypothetical protein